MAQGDFGGDASVIWNIDVDKLREGTAHSTGCNNGNGHGKGRHHQDGIDEVDPGESFTISIKAPVSSNDKNNLVLAMQSAAQAMSGTAAGGKVSFTLPIEPNNYDQISIAWNSSQQPQPIKKPAALAAPKVKKGSTKKVAQKKGAKKKR
jgi:hypothetical protein